MDILTAIHARRSVRHFLPTLISDDKIKTMLDAAMIAPSAGNAQPWQFVVITDRKLLDGIPDIHPYAAMSKTAPLGILVCGDLVGERHPGFWVQDCSAAMQNLLLAAFALELGAVWTGIHPVEERVTAFQKKIHLPKHIVPLGLALIGHTDLEQKIKSRYTPEKIHLNTWSEN